MAVLDGLRIFFSAIFLLFLPGFVWSFVFFTKRETDWIERIAISFGLSIAIVPLTLFWLNWIFDVRITLLNTSLIVCALIVVPAAYLLVRRPSLGKDVIAGVKNSIKETRRVTRASLLCSKLLGWLHSLQAFPPFKVVRQGLERSVDFLLIIEPGWVLIAAALVFLSYLLQIGAIFPWIGLAMAFLPFPLRWARQGSLRWRTSFDLPIVLLIAGALVGLITSPDLSLSLGAFQCILAISLFYYSWVNYLHLASLMKGLLFLGSLSLLVVSLLSFVELPHPSIQPNFVIGQFHGLALSLLIGAAISTGMAIFGRNTAVRVASGLLCLFFYVELFFLIDESLPRLVSWDSVEGRIPRWEKTIDMLGDSPLSGLGLGCWALAYHGSKVITHPTAVHNAYLELYANTGILGVLAFVSFLVIGFKIALDIIRSPRKHPWYGFGIGALLACLGTFIAGMVESAPIGVPLVGMDTYYYIVSPVPWLLAGFLISVHRLLSQEASLKIS